jgi:hypothetical protein
MAMANADLKKVLAEYKAVSTAFKLAEERRAVLKDAITSEMEARGVKVVEVDDYTAVLSTHTRESVSLDELVQEFGRDLLKAKKLINAYPVESLKVTRK